MTRGCKRYVRGGGGVTRGCKRCVRGGGVTRGWPGFGRGFSLRSCNGLF